MKLKTFIKFITILLVFIIQVIFLMAILKEKINHHIVPYLIIFVCAALIIVYKKSNIHHTHIEFDHFPLVLVIPISAIVTYSINNYFHLGSVFSAGIIGTTGSYLYLFNKKSNFLKQVAAPIYCGAFIGMTSLNIKYVYEMILVASLFTSLLYFITKPLYVGVGGKLGTLAFIGVLLSMLLFKIVFKI